MLCMHMIQGTASLLACGAGTAHIVIVTRLTNTLALMHSCCRRCDCCSCRDGRLSFAELRSCLAPFVPVPSALQLAADAEAYSSGRISVFALLKAAMALQPALLPALFMEAAKGASAATNGNNSSPSAAPALGAGPTAGGGDGAGPSAGAARSAAQSLPPKTDTHTEAAAPAGTSAGDSSGPTCTRAVPPSSTNAIIGSYDTDQKASALLGGSAAGTQQDTATASKQSFAPGSSSDAAASIAISAMPDILQGLVPSVTLAASDISHVMSMLQLGSSNEGSSGTSSTNNDEQRIDAAQLDAAFRLGLDASKRAAALQRAVDAAHAASSGGDHAGASKCALDPDLGGAELVMCKLSDVFASKKAAKKVGCWMAVVHGC